jgi:hypothetical protein
MTVNVTGETCIGPLRETVYIFLVIKQEEKKNIEKVRQTRADNSPWGPDRASSMCLPKSRSKILSVYITCPPLN